MWNPNYRSKTGLASFSGYRTRFSGPANVSIDEYILSDVTTQTLNLDPGEYVKSIKVSVKSNEVLPAPDKTKHPAIDGIEIITSNPDKKISFGDLSNPDGTIVSPSGWGIVGFYGTYHDNYEVQARLGHGLRFRSRIGAIMLPV
jgi:hypothetical protein